MLVICNFCGHVWETDDDAVCPNCGSISTQEFKEYD